MSRKPQALISNPEQISATRSRWVSVELVAPLLPLRRARFKRNSTRSTWAVDTESELGVSDFAAGELRLKAYFDCDKVQ